MEKWKALLVSMSVVASVGGLSGCMAQRINLVKAGVVSIHKDAEERMLLFPSVHEEHDRLIVFGTARPRWADLQIRGHVDITVTGPDGTILDVQHVPYRDKTPGKRPSARFRVIFPTVPPPGSVISVHHHLGTTP